MTSLADRTYELHSVSCGRSLHSIGEHQRGAVVIEEKPLVAMLLPQSNATGVLVCDRCLGPRSSLESQIASMSSTAKLPWLPLDDEDCLLGGNVPCSKARSCPARFCSNACEVAARSEYHGALCPGNPAISAAIRRFNKHALEEYDGFLFGARLVAGVACRAAAAQGACSECRGKPRCCSTCIASARVPLDSYWEQPCNEIMWWDVSVPPAALGSLETLQWRKSLQASAARSLELLLEILGPRSTAWLTLPAWGQLLGLVRRNALCVELPSPLAGFLPVLRAWLQATCGAQHAEGRAVEAMLDHIPRNATTPIQGSALFPRISCINHSCDPNAEVHFAREDFTASLVATRAIQPSEELSIAC